MKHIATLILIALVTLTATAQGGKFTIKGTAANPETEGCKVYLTVRDPFLKKSTTIDSTVVRNGTFTFTGEVQTPLLRQIMVIGDNVPTYIILEPGEIKIDMTLNKEIAMQFLYPYGTPLNNKLAELTQKLQAVNDTVLAIYSDIKALPKDQWELQDKKFRQIDSISKTYVDFGTKMFLQNADNVLGAYILNQKSKDSDVTFDEFDSLLNLAGDVVKNDPEIRQRVKINAVMRLVSPGSPFIDFNAKKVDNVTPVKLSDYVGRGKWVLVDFWASWCAPCMAELPNIKTVRDSLGDKIVILGVNVWDKPERCVAAIKQKEMTWENIIVPDNSATDSYGIESIPQIILFDPEGKIVERMRESTMFKIIEYYIKNYKK